MENLNYSLWHLRIMVLLDELKDFYYSSKIKINNLLRGTYTLNPDVFVNPKKYAVNIPIKKIVADSKVDRKGVELYKEKLKNNQTLDPIVVVKHPKKDLYAVLDGHHRYFAYLELGKNKVACAIAGDFSQVIFYLTKEGYLQPSAEISKKIRRPVKQMHKNLKEFLDSFAVQKQDD